MTLPYFPSFVLSGAPLVIDINWERVSSMVTVWMHRPWLSSYEIVHCPWKQILHFTEEKISSEVYTCCKISGILENLPHENVWIFAISCIFGAFLSQIGRSNLDWSHKQKNWWAKSQRRGRKSLYLQSRSNFSSSVSTLLFAINIQLAKTHKSWNIAVWTSFFFINFY